MGNKKKIFKMILEILLAIIAFVGAITILGIIFGPGFDLIEIIKFFLTSVIVLALLCLIVFFAIVFAFKFSKSKVGKESSKIDFENEKKYYRDILEHYSILELAYINNMSTLKEEDLTAGLLVLELKKVIKLQNNSITDINRNIPLVTNETHLLKNIIHGKLKVEKIDYLTEIVKKDSINRGLIQKGKFINKLKDILLMIIKICIIFLLTFASFYLLEYFLGKTMDMPIVIIICILSLITFALFITASASWIYLCSYIYHKFKSYELTDKGKEIKTKLDGLKWYIKDFGNLEDNEKESLTLWEDYLIYSVMFRTNKQIMKEMKNIIDIKTTIKIEPTTIFFTVLYILIVLVFLI